MSVVSTSPFSHQRPARSLADAEARARRQRVTSSVFLVLLWAATMILLALSATAVMGLGG